jgi:ABC-type lipoprotein export system ATPase subunit
VVTSPLPLLELRDVAKRFETPRGPLSVLEEISLTVRPGDFVVLTGPSGSGKSTLLHLAALLDRPTAGSVLLDGREVSSLSEAARCSLRADAIGMVFQRFHLLPHRNALDNVAFRFRYLTRSRAEIRTASTRALERFGLGSVAATPARLLSGGEMQRVAIARAIAHPPRLIVADEPTGNLDHASSLRVMEAFRSLHADGIAIVLATHNEEWLSCATHHVALRDGRLVEAAPR